MPSRATTLAALVALTLCAAAAHAQSPPTASEPKVPRPLLSPMVAEMFDAMEEQRIEVRALRAELARTQDAARVFELQKAIAVAKQAIELRLLRIQAAHARRAGRIDVAQGLEAAIEAMRTPSPGREPMPRPAPVRDDVR